MSESNIKQRPSREPSKLWSEGSYYFWSAESFLGSPWEPLYLWILSKNISQEVHAHWKDTVISKSVLHANLPKGIWRIQIIITIPGRTSWSPHPPGSSPNLAQDSLCLLHDQLFLALSHHDGRPASFCLGLVSVCILLSLWNTLRSMDNMPAWEPMRIWRNTPQAVLVTTTLATSQKILGFSWIQEIIQGSGYWWCHLELPWPTGLPACPIWPVSEVPFPGVSLLPLGIPLGNFSFQS